MESKMGTCRGCGEAAVSSEDYDGQVGDSDGICHNCGMVNSSGRITQDTPWITTSESFGNFQASNSLPKDMVKYNRDEKTPSPGYLASIRQLRCFSSVLSVSRDMTKGAESLFESCFYHPDFNHISLVKKSTLAGVCVYIVCRQNNWPISLKNISQTVGCSPSDFVNMKQKALALFAISLPTLTIEDHINLACRPKNMSQENIATIEQIIQLCRKVWILEGRHPEYIIAAAGYLAWKSEDSSKRAKTTFKQFCSKYKFIFNVTSKLRLSEITEVIICLGLEIPWLTSGVITEKSLPFHLPDVLKYQRTLYQTALIKAKRACEDRTGNSDTVDENTTKVVTNGESLGTSDAVPVCSATTGIKRKTAACNESDPQNSKRPKD